MQVEIVVAMALDRAIGKDNKLLWHYPEDMRHFKSLTEGNTVVMGRKTWESLPAKYRPLPNRKNIVLSRNGSYVAEGAVVVSSIDDISDHVEGKVIVIGGVEIYSMFLPVANVIHMTLVHDLFADADAHFPVMHGAWKETSREDFSQFSFITFEKV